MPHSRASRAGACALGLAGALGVGALPAGAAVPNVIYGGGAVSPAAPLTGLRVAPTGDRVTFEAQAIARCAGAPAVDDRLTARPSLQPDGSFRGAATRFYRPGPAESRTVSLSVAGQVLDARRAAGSMRLVVTVRRGARPAVRCDSGAQRWEVRSVTGAVIGPPGPRPGAAYRGTTNQGGRYMPFPFVLQLSPDARRVETALFRVFRRCVGARANDVPNNTPGVAIGADGSFAILQRYSQRFSDSVEDYTFTVRGRVGAEGAGGTLRASSVVRDPRTRRTIGRCDSGVLLWTAVP